MRTLITFERRPPLGALLLFAVSANVFAMCLIVDLGGFVVLAFPVFFAALHIIRNGRWPGLVAFVCLTPAFGFSLLASWSVGVLYAMITIPLFVVTLAVALAETRTSQKTIFFATLLASPLWVAFSAAVSFALWIVLAAIFSGLS